MPVAIDSNSRPGSTNSVPMGNNKNCGGSNSNGVNMNAAAPPVRPTTTSRRGGRSRSPVSTAIVVNRQHQQQQMAANNTHHGARNSKNTSGLGSHNNNNSNNTPSPAAGSGEGENPSLAAAAAAAAAAAYATGRGPPWPPQPPEGLPEDASGGYPHHLPPMYATDKVSYPPPNNWPGEDSYRRGGGGGGGGGYPGGGYDSRSPFPRDDYGDRRYHREPSSRYDDPRRYGPPRGMPPGQPYPPPPPDYHRYSGGQQHLPPPSHHRSRGVAQQHRLPPPPPHEHHHRPYHHRVEPQQHQPRVRRSGGDESRDLLLPLRSDLRSGKATNLVMGGATPIHLPKSPVVSSKQLLQKQQPPQPHRGSASSVFRGRPERNGSCSPVADNPDDENSPQKILLSFRTPTTSFEELKDKSSLVSSSNAAAKRKAADLLVGGGGGPSPEIHPNSQEDSPDHLFGPMRSQDAGGSIDIAPSFNPFNLSFDSFGDVHCFGVDSTLQADSFILGRADSVGNDVTPQQVLRKNSSGGNFSTQFLAHSGSGAITIGYSPMNSFGNASSSARRGGNTLVVGGHDPRSASPTQVLGMYQSYSGGATGRPLDDSHMRMSVGSFGGQSMSGYNRSYGGVGDPSASPSNYYSMGQIRSHESPDRIPTFYMLLGKFRDAFTDCTFLLPGVQSALSKSSISDRNDEDAPNSQGEESLAKASKWEHSSMAGLPYQGGLSGMYGEPTPYDMAIARRRVESSVCAFGGNLQRGRSATQAQSNREAIFRGKDLSGDKMSASVSPSSTDIPGQTSRKRTTYEDELPSRYYESDSRLSWEFEENPPVEVPAEDETEIEVTESGHTSIKTEHDILKDDGKGNSEDDQYCLSVSEGDAASTEKSGSTSPQAKMRYRCKLCGQPKQNHRCLYQQALARSIGVMVYPAVNAFTADEPGTIAAPLSEMNNFVDIQKDGCEPSPMRPTPDRMRRMPTGLMIATAQVTPETMRPDPRQPRSSPVLHENKKRMYSQMKGGSTEHGDLLFIEPMELKPEQFRVVSQSKSRKSSDAYVYPALPLPYAQRKRLSDNLFSLSNEVPKLTDECAQVLREAREKDMWDLAVAELMTQVIVIIHCSERDYRFEGLRQYLLTLGIAC